MPNQIAEIKECVIPNGSLVYPDTLTPPWLTYGCLK